MEITHDEAKAIISKSDPRGEKYWSGDQELIAAVNQAYARQYPGELASQDQAVLNRMFPGAAAKLQESQTPAAKVQPQSSQPQEPPPPLLAPNYSADNPPTEVITALSQTHGWGAPDSQTFEENRQNLSFAYEFMTQNDATLAEKIDQILGDNPALIARAAQFGAILKGRR